MAFEPFGFSFFGKKTAAAGTAYTQFIEPYGNPSCMTLLEFLQFTVGTTAHTLTILRPLSAQTLPGGSGARCSCYLTAAAAASQAVIAINQDPGVYTAYSFMNSGVPRTANNAIAANDYVMFQYPDGTWAVDTVASVSSLNITLTNNLATGGLAAGAPVWFFGITTDVNPYNAIAHPQYTLTASSTVNIGSENFPFMGTLGLAEPLLLYVNNATAASTLERASGTYGNRGGPYSNYA